MRSLTHSNNNRNDSLLMLSPLSLSILRIDQFGNLVDYEYTSSSRFFSHSGKNTQLLLHMFESERTCSFNADLKSHVHLTFDTVRNVRCSCGMSGLRQYYTHLQNRCCTENTCSFDQSFFWFFADLKSAVYLINLVRNYKTSFTTIFLLCKCQKMGSTKNFQWDAENFLGNGTYGLVYKVSKISRFSGSINITHNTYTHFCSCLIFFLIFSCLLCLLCLLFGLTSKSK